MDPIDPYPYPYRRYRYIAMSTNPQVNDTFWFRREPEAMRRYARSAWFIMLGCAGAVALMAIMGGAYLLFLVLPGPDAAPTADESGFPLNRGQMERVLSELQSRKAAYMAGVQSPATAADPSRPSVAPKQKGR